MKNINIIRHAESMANVVVDNPGYDLQIGQFIDVNIYASEAFKIFAKML